MTFPKADRRVFLGSSVLLAAQTLAEGQESRENGPAAQGQETPAVERDAGLPPDRRTGWAVVGLGDFALNQILPAFAQCRQSRLVALVSGNAQKARTVASQYGVAERGIYDYANFNRVADNPQIDVVYIILPNGLHAEYTIRAAEAGKHVMCEKPMANTVDECRSMIQACERARRKLMIAYRARFEPNNIAAIELLRGGTLGRLTSIVADHGRRLDPQQPRDRWRMRRALAGGGSLVDIGIYSLQAARYLTREEPSEIQAMMHSPANDARFREVEETVHFQLRFPSGVIANCTSSYGWSQVKRYRAIATEGWVELDPATAYTGNRMRVGRGDEANSRIEERPLPEVSQFAREMDHLSECIANNRSPRTPGEEGLQDVRLMQMIYESARNNRPVRVAPAV